MLDLKFLTLILLLDLEISDFDDARFWVFNFDGIRF